MSESDRDYIEVAGQTLFTIDARGRISGLNEPAPSIGPLMWLIRSRSANHYLLRDDVSASITARIVDLFASEPLLGSGQSELIHVARYAELLGARTQQHGVRYILPHQVAFSSPAERVWSGTAEADRLLERLNADGMPHGLYAMGFIDTGEFWPPWCAVLEDGVVASICFAARLGCRGAEAGVATAPSFRGQGYAAAAAAGWAAHPELENRLLGYSTEIANISSQQVALRLGLRMLGRTLAFD